MAAFIKQQQSWVAAKGTTWLTPEIFTLWPSTKEKPQKQKRKFADPWPKVSLIQDSQNKRWNLTCPHNRDILNRAKHGTIKPKAHKVLHFPVQILLINLFPRPGSAEAFHPSFWCLRLGLKSASSSKPSLIIPDPPTLWTKWNIPTCLLSCSP